MFHDLIDFTASQHRQYITESGCRTEVGEPNDLPREEAVGLWGFNMRAEGELTLGVIFLKKPEEDSEL